MQDSEKHKQKLDLVIRHRSEHLRFFVGWHNLEFFAVSPAKRSLIYLPVPVFWDQFESSRLLHVPSPICLFYFNSVVFGDDERNLQRYID